MAIHPTSDRANQRIVVLVLFAIASLAGGPAVSAYSSLSANDLPIATRTAFKDAVASLVLEDDARTIMEIFYSDYVTALDELETELDEARHDAGKERWEHSLSGRDRLDPETEAAVRSRLAEIDFTHWERASALFGELVESVATMAPEPDRVRHGAAFRALRRSVFFSPHRRRGNEAAYAGHGLDVGALIDDAVLHELAGLPKDDLLTRREAYHRDLDSVVVEVATAERRARLRKELARIADDPRGMADAEREAVAQWRRVHELNTATVEALAMTAAEVSGEDANAWRDRFQAACFPRLFGATRPERSLEWMRSRVDAETLEEAEAVVAEFVPAYRGVCGDAAALMVKARLTHGIALHGRMDITALDGTARGLFQELARNSGRRSTLTAEAMERLEAMLNDSERRSLRAVLRSRR